MSPAKGKGTAALPVVWKLFFFKDLLVTWLEPHYDFVLCTNS